MITDQAVTELAAGSQNPEHLNPLCVSVRGKIVKSLCRHSQATDELG